MTEQKPNIKVFVGLLLGILVVFLGFIGINEFTLKTGEDIYFKTAPVDPRDPLRGDYVILRYEFEQDELLEDYVVQNNIQNGEVLYLSFSKDSEDMGILSSVSETKPTDGLFLKITKTQSSWVRGGFETGIGKYFLAEGTGRKVEVLRGDMKVHTKLDRYGNAKIIDLYYEGEKIDPESL